MEQTKVTAHPLAWPRGFARTPAYKRERARFVRKSQSYCTERLTVPVAVGRLMDAFSRYTRVGQDWRVDLNFVVISTNLRTRQDGLPAGGQTEPLDPGVAVYFEMDGKARVMCCDRWNRVADNLAAVAATLEAMRGIERWGVAEASRAFTGFAPLPEPGRSRARSCWEVLGIRHADILGKTNTYGQTLINQAYRILAQTCHPDRGGSHEAMTELNNAREEALKHCS